MAPRGFDLGRRARTDLDGKKVAEQKHKGSIVGDLSAAEIMLGDPPCEMDIDEVRVSSVAQEQFDLSREPEAWTPRRSCSTRSPMRVRSPTGFARPGRLSGAGGAVSDGRLEAARFWPSGLCLSRGKTVTMLDHLASSGVARYASTNTGPISRTTRAPPTKRISKASRPHADEHGIQLLLDSGYLMSDIAPEWSKYHEQCLVLPRTGDYQRQPKQTA